MNFLKNNFLFPLIFLTFYGLGMSCIACGKFVLNKLTSHQIKDFSNYRALFFTPQGLLIDIKNRSPFIPFHLAAPYVKIEEAFLDHKTLIIRSSLTSTSPFQVSPSKSFLTETDTSTQQKLLRAIHWENWDRRVRYCHQCRGNLEKSPDLAQKQCTQCKATFFPNLAPAVIFSIQRDKEILLARSPHFKPGMYSVLAGFIDLGETAEEAVYREAFEEVGLTPSNPKYFGSQSWPFPSSFMIAFKTEYKGGTLRADPAEIEDMRWFSKKNLPELPPLPSISRSLIDSVLNDL